MPSKVAQNLCLEDGTPDYVRMILTSRVYDVCKETPCDAALQLSKSFGVKVLLKREDLHPVFSFKLRGAYNMISENLDECKRGVICCSAGNHAQGVAYSASKLGIPATIVMPLATPAIKVQSVARLGAQVVLHGNDFDEAKQECLRLRDLHNLFDVPPFDDPYVIAGQGTIGLEILRQIDVKQLKAVFVCVGGGGLISGISYYIKRLAPHVKIIGVETHDARSLDTSLKQKQVVTLDKVGLFADGTAVKTMGSECFRIASKNVDEVVLVNTDELCAAIHDVFTETRSIVEPSGALSVAGLKKWFGQHPEAANEPSSAYCAILSGANMDFERLMFVAERSKLGLGKEVFFIVRMPEQPGSFRKLLDRLKPRNITEVSYRYVHEKGAAVYMSFTVKDRSEISAIIENVEAIGMEVFDVSDNEFAKSHARYMVGGRPKLKGERLFMFEFPERSGALDRFLSHLEKEWNVSLFHYRNAGSDVARVAAAIQAENMAEEDVHTVLKRIGYDYKEETDNLAFQMFLH